MNRITMTTFGRWGRWGNQILEVAFLDSYARRYDARLELPDSELRRRFLLPLCEPRGPALPPYHERYHGDALSEPVPPLGGNAVNHDFRGYGQYHTSWYTADEQTRLRKLFRMAVPQSLWQYAEDVRRDGRPLVGIHLRRGDYGRLIFPITPVSWYLAWLKRHWPTLERPRLVVASEQPELVDCFGEYEPEPLPSITDMALTDALRDWYLLSQCDVVLSGNSTFAFTAAMTGRCQAGQYWRADLASERLEPTDPWDAWPILHQRQEDFPNVPGAWLASNPQW